MDEESSGLVDWAIFSQMRSELGASFVRILTYFREDGEKAVTQIEEEVCAENNLGIPVPVADICRMAGISQATYFN